MQRELLRFHATAAAVLAAAAAAACRPEERPLVSALVLEPAAAIDAPLNFSNDVALVTNNIACVVDAYEFQIRCLTRDGGMVGAFGRKGEGPGEFLGTPRIERADDDAVALLDILLDRVSVFSVRGDLLLETSMPANFSMRQLFGDRVFGITRTRTDTGRVDTPTERDLRSGEILWSRNDVAEAAGTDCIAEFAGQMSPSGSLVYWNCHGQLVFFKDRDGPGVVRTSPGRVDELPNDRDVEAYLEGIARITAGAVRAPPAVSEAYADEYRSKPKRWYFSNDGPAFRFDDRGRTWAATTRDRDERSYIEVWDGPEYLATVEIRDRLMGFDLLGDWLVAHVEREPDRDGIAARGIDWYAVPQF